MKMEQKERMTALLNSYLNNSATAEEREVLLQWVYEATDEELYGILDESFKDQGIVFRQRPEKADLIFKQIVHGETGGRSIELKVVRMWRKYGWVAAAVVLFIVCGLWFVVGRDKGERPSVALAPRVQQDVAPGREGAILTLADGRQIVLDSAGNGSVAQQGTVGVSKQGNQLVYDQQGKAAEMVYNTMSTPKGRQYSLVLSDGSKVWLNAASSIRFPTAFTGDSRVVEITGEAYFEVAHNPQKPFIVSVNDMKVEVLGTHFNINAYSDEPEVRTTLLEGKVRITKGQSIGILKPGQQASVSDVNTMKIINDVDVDEVVAWKNGYFQFENADIQTVMRQLARWYDVEVRYEGGMPQSSFSGKIGRRLTLEQVLKGLAETNVKYRIEEKRRIIIVP